MVFLRWSTLRAISFPALISKVCDDGCPGHNLSTTWHNSSSCVDIEHNDLRTWEPLGFLSCSLWDHMLLVLGDLR